MTAFTHKEQEERRAQVPWAQDVEALNLGTNWEEGERRSPYNADNPGPSKGEIRDGTTSAPSTNYKPTFSISRVLKVPESSFAGAGEGGLCAFKATAVAVKESQGQAIGATFGAITYSSNEGEHSLADGIGTAHIGISREGTRVGMGLFAIGRRETSEGRTTGMEVASDNRGEAEAYNGTLSGTKGIHLHAFGTANSAVGLVFGKPSTAEYDVGIGAVSGAVKTAFIRDDSTALRSILIKGTHEKAAISVASGSGGILVGAEEFSAAGPQLELYAGEANFDPIMRVGTGKPFASSVELKTEAGTSKWFMSASTNGFITESGNGGSGILFAASKIFTLARAGAARGMLRVNENGVAIGEGSASSFGNGKSVIFLANAGTVPNANPTGGGILYCEAGKLMYRGSSGTIKELATA